jgi:poly(hydroxyalkanoate) depolymerase family esterase
MDPALKGQGVRRLRRLLLAVLALPLAAAAVLFAAHPAAAASLTQVTGFGNNPGNLNMYIYVPNNVAARPAVLVAIHYCTGTASALYSGYFHDYVTAADQYGYIIVFPEATRSGQCFDVYSPQALTRNGGSDPVSIISMVNYTKQHYNVDAGRVFVSGVSSGAMMTNVMAAEYPDVFKAGSAFMGVPATCFATGSSTNTWNSQCANGQVTKTAQQWGDAARGTYSGYTGSYPRMQLWHGTADGTLNYNNFGEEIKQWTNLQGVSQTPVSTDSPVSGWTRTRYGSNTAQAPVEGVSVSGAGHSLPTSGMIAYAINFLGLNGTSTPPTSTPPTSSSPPPTGTTVKIVGKASNRCADITGQATTDGTRLQLYDCNNNWNQAWTKTGNTLVNPQSGKCVTASGTANSSAVTLSTCTSTGSQQWTLTTNGNLTNSASGRCLDAAGQGTTNGTQLQLYDCVSTGQPNQQWTLQ